MTGPAHDEALRGLLLPGLMSDPARPLVCIDCGAQVPDNPRSMDAHLAFHRHLALAVQLAEQTAERLEDHLTEQAGMVDDDPWKRDGGE